jgi:glyoxylase-like metal-dependent hydrolase (beta-lactamase superfamily II)
VSARDVGGGVTHIRMRTLGARALGIDVSAYLVGDVLVDTGFAYVREPLVKSLQRREISAICCTHSHEDHTGNAAVLSSMHGCPVYLRQAEQLWDEGVSKLAPYRQIWWGSVDPFTPLEMPESVAFGGRELRAIATPGHSSTQVALFEEATGDVFTGDLFVSPGATAVLIWANPWDEAESLRRVAALHPRRMLTGHGLIVDDPARHLELKADRIEAAARRAVEMSAGGVPPRKIVQTVFPKGRWKDRFLEFLTSRQFSRLNFVRAAVRFAPPESRRAGSATITPC